MRFEESPNYSSRLGNPIQLIVIHWTNGKFEGSRSWMKNKDSQVSAHYLLSQRGELIQLVEEENKAWHCGKSFLQGYNKDLNKVSIGIELEGPPSKVGVDKWDDRLLTSLVTLCKEIKQRYPEIKVTDHSTIAPGRKDDVKKGTGKDLFPWSDFIQKINITEA